MSLPEIDIAAETDEIIWHYTSVNVLWEFLKPNAQLYATHHGFTNDRQEIKYAQENFAKSRTKIREFGGEIEKKEENLYDLRVLPLLYLICFSKAEDDLSQWRAYSANGGFSIGFSRKKLLTLLEGDATLDHENNWWFRVYNDFTIVGDCRYYDENYRVPPVTPELRFKLNSIQYLLKNKHFSSEKEVRLIYFPHCLQNLELIGNKPRVAIHLKPKTHLSDAIVKIIVSPHGSVEENFRLASLFCYSLRLNEQIEVHLSKIPYLKI